MSEAISGLMPLDAVAACRYAHAGYELGSGNNEPTFN
jgi:hypothetical protein